MSWIHVVGALLLIICYTEAVKTCETMLVSGAYHHLDVNGYYDVIPDRQCYGRDMYRQRETFPGNDQMFIYFYKATLRHKGWLIGTAPCVDERQYADFYVWNSNQRPDRGLLSWVEYNDVNLFWQYNRQFSVICTEGLTYGAIVGIIAGCLIGLAIIIGLSVFAYHRCHDDGDNSSSSRPPPSQTTYSPPETVTTQVIQVQNPAYPPGYPQAPPGQPGIHTGPAQVQSYNYS